MTNLQKIAKRNGLPTVQDKLVEEMAELTSALINNNVDNIIEEIADVSIMLQQYIYLTESLDNVKKWHSAKLKRTMERLKLWRKFKS